MTLKKIFIIAGEESGDFIGAQFIKAAKKKYKDKVTFYGVGGKKMSDEGLDSILPLSEFAYMGFIEILPHIFKLKSNIKKVIQSIHTIKPDLILTIDAQGLAIQIAKKIKNIKKIHYVAPTVWAWRKNRIWKYERVFDGLFCIFPFEPDYFKETKLKAQYVGHPILETQSLYVKNNKFREKYRISEEAKVLCLLPGSRVREVETLIHVLKETSEILSNRIHNLHIILPTVPTVESLLRKKLMDWSLPVTLITDHKEKYPAFAEADVALAASGSVSLELAMANTPMVTVYRVSKFSQWLLRKLIYISHVNIVNIILNFSHKSDFKPPIKEFIQGDYTSQDLSHALEALFDKNSLEYKSQIEGFSKVKKYLQKDGNKASDVAAEYLETYLND